MRQTKETLAQLRQCLDDGANEPTCPCNCSMIPCNAVAPSRKVPLRLSEVQQMTWLPHAATRGVCLCGYVLAAWRVGMRASHILLVTTTRTLPSSASHACVHGLWTMQHGQGAQGERCWFACATALLQAGHQQHYVPCCPRSSVLVPYVDGVVWSHHMTGW